MWWRGASSDGDHEERAKANATGGKLLMRRSG
jgi:hypothetical protein